jgi:large subunit ribosomal protein L17
MRHHKKGRKFTRTRGQKVALMRSLACSLIRDEKIVTTEAKAKELRPYIEKLVTRAKTDTLAARRVIISKIVNEKLTKKLFEVISPEFKTRKGGYTRITKLPIRKNDAAEMAQIEFVK